MGTISVSLWKNRTLIAVNGFEVIEQFAFMKLLDSMA